MRRVALLALATALGGCALFSKGETIQPRYFDPLLPAHASDRKADPTSTSSGPKLRMGRLKSSEHLRQQIVFRDSPVEIGTYTTYRWTEEPEEYVRRAMIRSLFDDRGLTQTMGGFTPIVDIEVLAFEEIRTKGKHAARVEISYSLHDDRVVIAANTVAIERPVARHGDMRKVVEALSVALEEVCSNASEEISAVLTERRAKEVSEKFEASPQQDASER